MKNITGERFGNLIVLKTFKNKKNYLVCECQCDCGNTKVVYKSNLMAGRTKSCGCLEEQNRRKFRNLVQQRFGRLTAIEPTQQRTSYGNVIWRCACDCGTFIDVSGCNLVRGYTKSCGCLTAERKDISNRRFGNLLTLYPDSDKKTDRTKWICRCDCGNICTVSISNLRNGHTKSCGCLANMEHRTLIEGTCLELIASPYIPQNNCSGVKGVSYYSRTNSWVATLTFQGRNYYLGRYETVEEAARARCEAEKTIVWPFLEKYEYLIKADS